jgi:hypothetical protein
MKNLLIKSVLPTQGLGAIVSSVVGAWQSTLDRKQERDIATEKLAFERERFEHKKHAQREGAERRRAELRQQAAARLEEIRANHETRKLFELWPLRLVPAQYAACDAQQPLALKTFVAFDESLRPLAADIEERLRGHFAAHYPAGSERPVAFIGGAWSGTQPPSEAAIHAVFHSLAGIPSLALLLERIRNVVHFRIAYWSARDRAVHFASLGETTESSLLAGVARREASRWREARDTLLQPGAPADVLASPLHEHNLAMLQQEEQLRGAGIDPADLAFDARYRIDPRFSEVLVHDVGRSVALIASAIADVHFLIHDNVAPRTPAIVRTLLDGASDATVRSVAESLGLAFQVLIDERQLWEPELLVEFAQVLADFPDPSHALAQAHASMRAWLTLRRAAVVDDPHLPSLMRSLVTRADEPYVRSLASLLATIGAAEPVLDIDWSNVADPPLVRNDDAFSFGPAIRVDCRNRERGGFE